MLMGPMRAIGVLYYWTWFLWPFLFVGGLVYAIAAAVKNDGSTLKPVFLSSVSLLVILAGILYPSFS